MILEQVGKRVPTFTICCHLIASLTYLILMMPYGLTQSTDKLHTVEPTPALNLQEKELTTVLLVSHEASDSFGRFHSLRPEVGLLTSTARTFIQSGVTTEYATQVVGTTLDNGRVYAQYLKKSSRVLYEGASFPAVVTSWVGDSSSLPQSHNDLYNADRPDWQDQDDRLRKVFVGNTDFVGNIYEKQIKEPLLSVASTPLPSFLSESSSLKTFAVNHISRNGELEDNAKKLAAQKVLPIADLPTYTVKNSFSPSGFSWGSNGQNVLNKSTSIIHNKVTAFDSRTPKQYYQQRIGTRNGESENPKSLYMSEFLQKRKLATTTYYGFADFTTIVGDSVIVFSPSSSSQAVHVGQVTSIKGEATLNDLNLPHVSYVSITASEDLIVPSSTQEYQTVKLQTTSMSTVIEASLTTAEEILEYLPSETNLVSVNSETPSLKSSILISSDRVEKITSDLSTPSDEQVSAIFHLLQKKAENSEIDITKNIQGPNTEYSLEAVSMSKQDMVLSSVEPSTVPTLGGATTIFFEEDPFANFIDPSSSVEENILSHNQEVITENKVETTTYSSVMNFSAINNSSLTDKLSSSVEQASSLQTKYSIISTIESTQLRQNIPLNPTTISSGVIIKELIDNEGEILDETDCLHTSQVFLTQLPKVITYLTTHFTSMDSLEVSESSSVETNVINTFDIVETTKKYCIQPTSVSNVVELTQTEEINQLTDLSNESNTTENQIGINDSNILEDEEDKTTTAPTDIESSSGDGAIDEEDDSIEEFELIFKTLYTTYTYLTTIFQESSTSVLSHTEVITNVVTSTLGDIESSAFEELETEIMPTSTLSYLNKYTVLNNLDSIIRKEEDSFEEKDNMDSSLLETPLQQSEDFDFKTFHTTYTYFTTIFTEGETDVISRTEVLTNIIKVKPTETFDNTNESFIKNTEDNTTYNFNSSDHGDETLSAFPLNYSTMIRNFSLSQISPVFDDFASITLVTDVRSSSSNGEGHVINDTFIQFNNRTLQEPTLDDQISSESNTEIFPEEIVPSATLLLQTSFTTFTYYTTMYNNNLTNVISRLETITNVVTETLSPSVKSVHFEEATLPVTYFTTFTYWTKLAKDGVISTLSREETISNIVTPTSVNIEGSSTSETIDTESLKESAILDELITTSTLNEKTFVELPTKTLEPTTYYTTYTYYTTSYESDKTITHSRFETITNILTPTVSTTPFVASTEFEDLKIDSMRQNEKNLPSKKDIVLYDYKKIIDSDGVSTLFFETQVVPSINEHGVPVDITSSSSSLYIDEFKKTALSTPILSITVNAEGSSVPVRQYKTGLVRLIEGTRIANNTTTLYQSRVIGTLIDNRYAQIIESTSSFLFEQLPSLTSNIIVPSKTLNDLMESTKKVDQSMINLASGVLESSIGESSDTTQQLEDETTQQPEDIESSEQSDKDDQPPQSKKRIFTPVIRPFASRNRPQFAPKKKTGFASSATIITRSDFTPTITVTPALKSTGRFSSIKKNSVSLVSGSSSRRFGRPSKISAAQSFSTAPNSTSFGGGRNRFAVSSRGNSALGPSIRRPVSRSSVGGSANFRPGFSSGYNSNARFRIKPTAAFGLGQNNKPTDLLTSPQADTADIEEEDSTQEQTNEEDGETTTENSRRNQNPLLRFRRPLSRPNDIAITTNQRGLAGGSNNLVSTRRNPLTARSKVSTSSTSTTTTTPRSRPRGFQRPTIAALSGRQRPQSSLFPPRGLFQKQDEVSNTLNKNSESEGGAVESADGEDDIEYEDDESDDTENDGPERKRRSHSKLTSINFEKTELQHKHSKHQNRPKREADVSYPPRTNFRSRFRRPKTGSSASVDERKIEEDDTPETSTIQSTTRPGRINSRFGIKQHTQLSSPASTTAVAVSHRGIRPTRPNNGRAQFTLREKDISSTTKTYQRHNVASFRRPQTTVSSRRASTSITNNRRLKTYTNNNIGMETSPRSGNTASRMRGSTLNSGRSRSPPRGRNRNDFNVDVVSNIFDGTITVTHVIPSEVTIPVVNGQLTEYKNVITAKTSTEVLGPQQYTTYVGTNGQSTLALTREESTTNIAGATEITQFILHETPTTTITFTPTTIRGRKTSFSHILPSTVYSVEKLVSTMQPQLANAPLANILLSQLLLGNIGLPGQAPGNPLLGAINQPILASQMPLSPVTEYRTHTSTYVTTIFEGMSTVLPVTFQGKKIITTVYDTTAQTITATEFITDTIVTTPTQQAVQSAQVNSLLLQQLLLQQQIQPQLPQEISSRIPLKEFLQPESNLQELDSNNIQDPEEDTEISAVEETQLLKATARKKQRKSGKSGHRRNKSHGIATMIESSVITLYVSGRRPGEFSTILSTVQANTDSTLQKRQADINVKKTIAIDDEKDFYTADGSDFVNEYSLPETIEGLKISTSSQNDNHLSLNFLESNENLEQTQTLESIVGDVSLWLANSPSISRQKELSLLPTKYNANQSFDFLGKLTSL